MDDAALQGGAERLDVIRRCDRDDVHGRPARRVELPEDLEAGTVGEVDVEQHQIRALILRPGERITRGMGDADDQERWQALDEPAVDLRDAEIVLDDQRADRSGGRRRAHVAAVGIIAVNTAPPSFATRTQPPRRWATWRTRASPIP